LKAYHTKTHLKAYFTDNT